jgi:predicted ABC-type transport system involved in lysophospholipase L1 biosynthesis ATPase subunit
MQVITLLDTLCREHGCTLVVATHDVNIAVVAQPRLRMIDGRLQEA